MPRSRGLQRWPVLVLPQGVQCWQTSRSFTGFVKHVLNEPFCSRHRLAPKLSPTCGQLQGFSCLLCTALNCAKCLFLLAEAQGFEPWIPCGMLVFKTSAIDHSAKLPTCYLQQISRPVQSTTLPSFLCSCAFAFFVMGMQMRRAGIVTGNWLCLHGSTYYSAY